MQRKAIPKAEAKLSILYILNQLGPITNMQLVQYVGECDLIDYFSLQMYLAELLHEAQIVETTHLSGVLLSLTATGRNAVENWIKRIPPSKLSIIQESSDIWKNKFQKEQQAPVAFYPTKDGGTCLRLQLMEKDWMLMDLLLTTPGTLPTTTLSSIWYQKAPDVYQMIMGLLACPEADVDAICPENTALQFLEGKGWQVVLGDNDEQITLILVLPDENLGRTFACNWENHKKEIYNNIHDMLIA